MSAVTIQTGIHNSDYSNSITDYALFMGGTNVAHDVLAQYDPLKTGYNRIFMVRKPVWLDAYFGGNGSGEGGSVNKLDKFKHILEYGNVSISGLSDISVETNSITGGYVGKSFEIPSYASDGTNSLSIQVYEFSGSPVREVLHEWINGTTDLMSGLTHYNGYLGKDNKDAANKVTLTANQANQTAEFIYVATDCTGTEVEYACMFANCFPKNLPLDQFNYSSGQHELVETTIEFTATKYESTQINKLAQALLDKYKVLSNSLNFYSGIDANSLKGPDRHYDNKSGKLVDGSASFKEVNSPTTEWFAGSEK